MQRFEHVVVNQNGTFLPSVSVTVTVAAATPGTGAAASLFSDEGTTSLGTNVVVSDSNGRVVFYTPDGKYDLSFTGVGITTYIRAAIEIADMTGNTFAADSQGKFNTLAVSGATTLNTLTVSGAVTLSSSLSVTSLIIGGGTSLTTSNQTGTGNIVLNTSPTLVTPNIGVATATSVTTAQFIQTAATIATWKDNTGGTRASIPSNGTSQGTLNNWNLTGGSSISGTAIGGTSGSGNVLFDTSPTITTPTIARETINTGVSQGSGFKHQRFTGICTTAATADTSCASTLTWTSAFADANYTVVCQGEGNTGNVAVLAISSHVAASVTVNVITLTNSAVSFNTVTCIAVHD
jgi:hypothetical protein